MSPVRVVIAIVFISIGVFFSIVSVLGTFRFKFVLNRMHSAAMGDTLALLFVLLGLIVITQKKYNLATILREVARNEEVIEGIKIRYKDNKIKEL